MSREELSNAILSNDVYSCKKLIEDGITPSFIMTNKGPVTHFELALMMGNKLIINILKENGAKLDDIDQHLFNACHMENATLLKALLKYGANPRKLILSTYSNSIMFYPLDYCYFNYDCIKLLLKHGADPNVTNSNHATLLHRIMGNIYLDTKTYKIGFPPLEKIRAKIIKLLLKYGAKYDIPDANGKTALKLAITNNVDSAIYLFTKDMKKKQQLRLKLLLTAHEFDESSLVHRDYLCRDLFLILIKYI